MKREMIYRTDAMAAIGNLKELSDEDRSKAMQAMLDVPSVQTCDDAVSRQQAIDAICDASPEDRAGMEENIKALPSAQPEIIACGDCIHWICHDRRCGYWNHGVKPLDFCSKAERRTDE